VETSTEVLRQLVSEEIERLVDDAKREGCAVHAGYLAGMPLASYPGAELAVGRIIGELVLAARRAGVPVEVGELRYSAGTYAVAWHRLR
jgi:hypothetical protein